MEHEPILDELKRLASSEQFARSKRLLRFLHFTVERTLNGESDILSEYSIGRQVYDRAEDFDPLTDGIVRVEAHRLRTKLREYYRSAGRQDPVIIEYPVGFYTPTFHRWTPEFLPRTGKMAAVIRSYDWSASALGPMVNWPRELKSAVSLCLHMKFPAAIVWRPDFTVLYNDAMHALIDRDGADHIGKKLADLEAWASSELAIRAVCETGEATFRDRIRWLFAPPNSRESYFTTSFSPIPDSTGSSAGVLIVATDVTDSVVSNRRGRTLSALSGIAQMASEDDACREASRVLESNPYDLPFASIYLLDPSRKKAELRASTGIQPETGASPETILLSSGIHPLASAALSARAEILEVGRQLGPLPSGAWTIPPRELVVVPLQATREREQIGLIIAGANPYCPVDTEYRAFFEAVARHTSALIIRAGLQGKQRKLATEMEQQKRTWASFLDFASKEFRTPLTVTLGLLDKVLGEYGPNEPHHAALRLTRRTTLRLWNAVDTFLDLIRVQTDRLKPVFAPVDLSSVTEELARAFASELARPNISFSLDCPPLGENVYVDRRLWERLILGLLVSAVSRTDAGEIGISIRRIGPWIDTAVWDTGTSIPEHEKTNKFEPFGSGGSVSGRTGLSLARHFAARHGGHVTVESGSGKGNKFVVSIPRGRAHLAAEHVLETPEDIRASVNALHAFVEDATRWTPENQLAEAQSTEELSLGSGQPWQRRTLTSAPPRRILVAVSDRDLRHYLCGVLKEPYTVESTSDGQETLESLHRASPDLLLVDSELRIVDGLGVLRAIRSHPALGSLPVVVMSPRSSEAERLNAFAAGASDYLVKPFSAPELLVRLESQISLADRHKVALARERESSLLKDTDQLNLLRSIVDQLPIGVAIVDLASREFVVKNRRICELLGNLANLINTLEDIPEIFGSRFDGTPLYRSDCALFRAVEHGEIVVEETMIYHLPERHVPLAVSASPIRGSAGTHIGAVMFCRPYTNLV
jgi:signal transduction histidine kinase/DNA-binding response OmpR family regulator